MEARRPREQLLFLMGLIAENRRMRSYLGLPRSVDLADKIGFRRVGYVLCLNGEVVIKGEFKIDVKVMGRPSTPLATMQRALKWLYGCDRLISKENIHRTCLSNFQILNSIEE
jgi:hypothetical protein